MILSLFLQDPHHPLTVGIGLMKSNRQDAETPRKHQINLDHHRITRSLGITGNVYSKRPAIALDPPLIGCKILNPGQKL